MSPLLFLSAEEKKMAKNLAMHSVEIQKNDPLKKVTLLFKEKPDRHYSGSESVLIGLHEDATSSITLLDLMELN